MGRTSRYGPGGRKPVRQKDFARAMKAADLAVKRIKDLRGKLMPRYGETDQRTHAVLGYLTAAQHEAADTKRGIRAATIAQGYKGPALGVLE